MTGLDITRERLHNQLITASTLAKPHEVVAWMGAVQSQDYAAAKWALGLRLPGLTDNDIEQSFSSGTILRTHVMRPTWHFVSPADIRWLLALTAPRVHAFNASYYRRLEVDDDTCARSNAVLTGALQGGKQLTRPELVSALQQAGIVADDTLRFTLLVMHAELDGIICSGARRGKQFTYALLDERVPQTRTLDRDEALAECTRRYFTSHGPATAQDFAWWSGLTPADAKVGIEMVASQLLHEMIDGQTYWFSASSLPAASSQTAHLLPNYDEYTVGYTDRSALLDESHLHKFDRAGGALNYVMVLDGRVAGTWKRTLKKNTVSITLNPFIPLNSQETRAFAAAADRYGAFLAMSVNATFES